ncbi:hypothetical protein GCM10007978_24650 [Shewanella hanedai]|nr:hypothetical protein GCM10007978_24650 [Shewanella hanedai]
MVKSLDEIYSVGKLYDIKYAPLDYGLCNTNLRNINEKNNNNVNPSYSCLFGISKNLSQY